MTKLIVTLKCKDQNSVFAKILSANGLDKNNNTLSMKKQIILKIKM